MRKLDDLSPSDEAAMLRKIQDRAKETARAMTEFNDAVDRTLGRRGGEPSQPTVGPKSNKPESSLPERVPAPAPKPPRKPFATPRPYVRPLTSAPGSKLDLFATKSALKVYLNTLSPDEPLTQAGLSAWPGEGKITGAVLLAWILQHPMGWSKELFDLMSFVGGGFDRPLE